jgi:hypothetical protein
MHFFKDRDPSLYPESTPIPASPLPPPSAAWFNKHPAYQYLRTISPDMISTATSSSSSGFNQAFTTPELALPNPSSVVMQAIQELHQFAVTSSALVDKFSEELAATLSLASLPPIWTQAIDSTLMDPHEAAEDPMAGLNRLNDKVPSLLAWGDTHRSDTSTRLPTSTLKPPSTSTSSIRPPAAISPAKVLSAFSVAGVSGYVYLEAELGKYPQQTDIMVFLR